MTARRKVVGPSKMSFGWNGCCIDIQTFEVSPGCPSSYGSQTFDALDATSTRGVA
jgi:hypothetical protein